MQLTVKNTRGLEPAENSEISTCSLLVSCSTAELYGQTWSWKLESNQHLTTYEIVILPLNYFSIHGTGHGIRTHTWTILSRLPLPLGYSGISSGPRSGTRTRTTDYRPAVFKTAAYCQFRHSRWSAARNLHPLLGSHNPGFYYIN